MSTTRESMVPRLEREFEQVFGRPATARYFCPGRVNLIGEHLDYNGGTVLPAAIDLGIFAFVAERQDDTVRLHSVDKPPGKEVRMSFLEQNGERGDWSDYPQGVLRYLQQEGVPLRGADILFGATLPIGAGLSSSAAIEVLSGYIFRYGMQGQDASPADRTKLALLCQQVENEALGVKCGIMDQFSVAMGRARSAILLQCDSLEYRYVPLRVEGYSIYVLNSRKARALAESRYNARRAECDEARRIIASRTGVANLAEATVEDLALIDDEIVRRRARHVVTESRRVTLAAEALEQGDALRFGLLMRESHESLRDDFEVTGPELDALALSALEAPGCVGARMTGAGFGGCAIALVRDAERDAFVEQLSREYRRRVDLEPEVYLVHAVDGVHLLQQ